MFKQFRVIKTVNQKASQDIGKRAGAYFCRKTPMCSAKKWAQFNLHDMPEQVKFWFGVWTHGARCTAVSNCPYLMHGQLYHPQGELLQFTCLSAFV